jgi:hypothetical protein
VSNEDLWSGFQNTVSERFPNGENQLAAEKGYPGIGCTPEGGPDFAGSDYLYATSEGENNIVQIEMTGGYTGDADAANAAANLNETPSDYTWHHVDDFDPATGKATLQLVERSAHRATYPHFGGVGQYNAFHGLSEYGS